MEIPSLLQICISKGSWGLWGPESHRDHAYETPVWGTICVWNLQALRIELKPTSPNPESLLDKHYPYWYAFFFTLVNQKS